MHDTFYLARISFSYHQIPYVWTYGRVRVPYANIRVILFATLVVLVYRRCIVIVAAAAGGVL